MWLASVVDHSSPLLFIYLYTNVYTFIYMYIYMDCTICPVRYGRYSSRPKRERSILCSANLISKRLQPCIYYSP